MAPTKDFPVADMGEVAQSPEVMPLDWEFQLAGGREIFLTRIQQHRTYGGMLCGLPDDPGRTVCQRRQGVVSVGQEFPRGSGRDSGRHCFRGQARARGPDVRAIRSDGVVDTSAGHQLCRIQVAYHGP